jgi:hypothetical protein
LREMVAVIVMSLRAAVFAATVHLFRMHVFPFVICSAGPGFVGDDRIIGTNGIGGGMSSAQLRGGTCSRR